MAVSIDGTPAGNIATGAVATSSVTVTVGANSNRCLVALIGNDNTLTVSGVAYTAGSGGTWTKLGSIVAATSRELEIWYSTAPSTGSVTVRATFSANITTDGTLVLLSLYNVDQTTPLSNYASDGVGSSPTITGTLSSGGLVVGMVCANGTPSPVLTGTADFNGSNNMFWNAAHNAATATLTWTGAANARGLNIANVNQAAVIATGPAIMGAMIMVNP